MGLPRKIIAKFEIVTPMFLGDADQQATRISEASIKGALAFWWRALNFAGFVVAKNGDLERALEAMQAREQLLFGGEKVGQGAFLLKVTTGPSEKDSLSVGEVLAKDGSGSRGNTSDVVGEGARYLGYGVLNAFYTKPNPKLNRPAKKAGELERSCFRKGLSFEVQFVMSPRSDSKTWQELEVAIKAFGLFGGLGARKRRGWGSVALIALTVDSVSKFDAPLTRQKYIETITGVIGKNLPAINGSQFELTALASETDIRVGAYENANSLEILNEVGTGLLRYRAWGHPKGAYGGIDVDAGFQDDHDWFKKEGRFKGTGRGAYIPKRSAFGLPHNYSKYFGVTANGDLDRRASPLMFHIHKFGSRCGAVAMLMPVKFLPENQVSVWEARHGGDTKTPYSHPFSAKALSDFLTGTKHQGGQADPAYFPSTKVYQP